MTCHERFALCCTSRFPASHLAAIPALLALALLLAPTATAQHAYTDSYPKNFGIDVQGYVFELDFTDGSDHIAGRATVNARFVDAGQSTLRLDLNDMVVSDVTMNGVDVSWTHSNGVLMIDLGQTVPAGELRKVTVSYAGTPTEGLDIGPNKYGDWTWFSDNWSSQVRHWLPTVDHPYDKATSEMIVRVPDAYQVGSNGTLAEETDLEGGMRLTHWKNPVPTATWLFFVGVADFAVDYVADWRGVSIETWVYRQDRDKGFYDFAEPTERVLAYYTDLIGPYVNRRLANVVSNATPGGGMEAASMPAYSVNSVSGNRARGWQHVIIHEIAHQWFGNAVTQVHWNDVWLSEGFATYYTLLFREHHYGHDDFVAGLKDARRRVVDFYEETPDFQIVRPYIEDLNAVSGLMMYQKGAWILHMLREMLGEDVYHAGIRSYYAEYINRNAQTADLQRHLEEASGQDLQWYFDQWLFQGGIPVLEGSWRADSEGVRVALSQVQDARYRFALSVDVDVVLEDGSRVRRTLDMPVSGAVEVFLPVEGTVGDVILDPDTRLLADWEFVAGR